MKFQHLKHNSNIIEKKKMYLLVKNRIVVSCLVIGGLALIGTGGTIVQASDNSSTTSVSQKDTVSDDYFDGMTGDDGWSFSKISWYVYEINGSSDNVLLKLGDSDSDNVNVAVSSVGTGNFDWSNYFDKITSIEVVGGIKTADVQTDLFSSMPNLKAVTGLDRLETSGTKDFTNMFFNDSGLESLDLSKLDMSTIQTVSSMFKNDTSLQSLDLSALNMSKVKTAVSMFLGDKSLTSVKFPSNMNALENVSDMFNGDSSLESLDLSNIDMSNVVNSHDMLSWTQLSSLTLSPTSVITDSGLSNSTTYTENGKTYVGTGWQNKDDPTQVVDATTLMNMYSTGNQPSKTITWIPANVKEQTNYYIQYVDSKTGDKIYSDTSNTYPGSAGDSVNFATIAAGKYTLSQIGHPQAGYSADSILNDSGKIVSDGNGGYDVEAEVEPLDPVDISVTQTVGSDTPTTDSFTIPVNDASYRYSNITEPSNGTIDLNKSTIKIGDADAVSFKDYGNGSDLNAVLSNAISQQTSSNNGMFGDTAAGTTPITINTIYTKKSTGGGGSSSGNENTGTANKVTQTVGTTTKVVSVYDKKGKLITNRALGKNTGWISDQEYTLDGTLYYRVATNEYVKASDVYVYVAQKNVVRVHDDQIGYLVDAKGNKISNRALKSSTDWVSDRYTMINGEKYYRVATNEFVNASYASIV
ncbi:SLAP domain-containing protein [Companilactobacillus jidongensis]|uniref:SLAP domain-containing protein n=1 Tax=Companilactobacillus jidongensis TaxID=2486006 RepID=UPI0013DE4A19|nr:SLAP domain-containing protein [Companilactobacillus jidongensis]